jgi:4-hydroxymandelate oxidase
MSADILGTRYNTPIVIAPIGGHKAYHGGGEEAVARAARAGGHLMILSTQSTTSPYEGVDLSGLTNIQSSAMT